MLRTICDTSRKKSEHFNLDLPIELVLRQERANTIECETNIEEKLLHGNKAGNTLAGTL